MHVRRGGRRLPLREAAEALSLSKDALRQRVRRGTIPAEKGEDGRVYVYLDATTNATTDGENDLPHQPDRTAELIATLRDQLQAERRANEENRRIIAALTQRIPEIEAPRGSPETPESPGPTDTPTDPGGEPETPASRAWWRRVFVG